MYKLISADEELRDKFITAHPITSAAITTVPSTQSSFSVVSDMPFLSFNILTIYLNFNILQPALYISNNYNTGVSLSLGTIEAAVGYQVGTSWSSTAHYEIDVPIGKSGFIQARDIVDVKEFNILTTIVIGDENPVFEHATGWSSQWKQFRYTGYTFQQPTGICTTCTYPCCERKIHMKFFIKYILVSILIVIALSSCSKDIEVTKVKSSGSWEDATFIQPSGYICFNTGERVFLQMPLIIDGKYELTDTDISSVEFVGNTDIKCNYNGLKEGRCTDRSIYTMSFYISTDTPIITTADALQINFTNGTSIAKKIGTYKFTAKKNEYVNNIESRGFFPVTGSPKEYRISYENISEKKVEICNISFDNQQFLGIKEVKSSFDFDMIKPDYTSICNISS